MQFRVNRKIRRLVRDSGLRQRDIAEKIGISPQVLSNICRCKRFVYADEVEPIANALGVEVDELFQNTADCALDELCVAVLEQRRKKNGGGKKRRSGSCAYRNVAKLINANFQKAPTFSLEYELKEVIRSKLVEMLRGQGLAEDEVSRVLELAVGEQNMLIPGWHLKEAMKNKLIGMLGGQGLTSDEALCFLEFAVGKPEMPARDEDVYGR